MLRYQHAPHEDRRKMMQICKNTTEIEQWHTFLHKMAQIAKHLDFCELRRNCGIRRKTELREVAWSCVTLRGVAWPAWAVCVVLRGVAWSCVVLRGAPPRFHDCCVGPFFAQKHKLRSNTEISNEKHRLVRKKTLRNMNIDRKHRIVGTTKKRQATM